jgi:hypothetical protein
LQAADEYGRAEQIMADIQEDALSRFIKKLRPRLASYVNISNDPETFDKKITVKTAYLVLSDSDLAELTIKIIEEYEKAIR